MFSTAQKIDTFPSSPIILSRQLLWSAISIGIFLRVFHYLYNRSLFGDEAYVAINIVNRNIQELASPLEYRQQAPFAFLVAVELLSNLLGINEFALRLFSLLSGIAAILLYYKFSKAYLGPLATFIGVCILCFSPPLIYYSSELKQYATELVVTVVLYLSFFYYKDKTSLVDKVCWGLIGAVLVWFAFPAVFVMAGIGISAILPTLQRKSWKDIAYTCLIYVCWGASFLINYLFFVERGAKDGFLQEFWESHFMPPVYTPEGLRWVARSIYQTLNTPLGMDYSILAIICFGAGLFWLWKYKREIFWITLIPIVLTLVASALHKYPFHKRFLLFLTPAFILIISAGANALYYRIKTFSKIVSKILEVLLIAPSLLVSLYQVVKPQTLNMANQQEIRPVIQWMLAHKQPGDKLIVNNLASAQFRYYSRLFNIEPVWVESFINTTPDKKASSIDSNSFFVNFFDKNNIHNTIDTVPPKRLWVLFARNKQGQEETSVQYLNGIGKQLTSFKKEKASVYLYNLNRVNK
jgi:4-amino-4-deoxy-L-arabinose transferase-like glycosyltransferase